MTAGKPYAHLSQKGDLEIRACSLEDPSKPSKLFCSIDGKNKYALCKLTQTGPSCRIGGGLKGLFFEEDVTLSCEGGPIHLSGLLMPPGLSGGTMEIPEMPPPPSLAKREFLDKLRDEMVLGQPAKKKQKTLPAQAQATIPPQQNEPLQKKKQEHEKPAQAEAQPQKSEPQKKVPEKPAEAKAQPGQAKAKAEAKAQPAQAKAQPQKSELQKKQKEPEKKQEPEKDPVNPLGKKRLPSGLQYEVLRPGKGKMPASNGKTVHVQYDGRLAKTGKRFDKGKIKFRLGLGEVISGWDQGVKGMFVGERRRLLIPSHLGYGRQGAPGAIPPNADLVFEVELLNC